MVSPTTYSEWVNLLDRFGSGDDTSLEELNKASFTVDAGTASRFYARVEEVYRKRKQNWLDKFQRSFQLQNLKNEEDFEIVLRNCKQNFSPLIKFISLNGLPNDIKNTLKKDLEDFVSEIKKSLKDNISRSSSGREKMLILLNNFGLHKVPEEIKTNNQINRENTNQIIPPTGRKIIF